MVRVSLREIDAQIERESINYLIQNKMNKKEQEKFGHLLLENLFDESWLETNGFYSEMSDQDLLRAKEITYQQIYRRK